MPALVRAAGERAQTRFWEFFVVNIRSPHTRRAYGRAIGEFLAWCGSSSLSVAAAAKQEASAHGGVLTPLDRTSFV
jgi:hypothetical protein